MLNLRSDLLQAVIFDWDNTLADTQPVIVAAINQTLREYNLPPLSAMMKFYNHQLSFWNNFPNLFGADKAAAAYETYCRHYKRLAPQLLHGFDGVEDVLQFLHRRHIKLLIVSNKDRRLLEYELPLLYSPSLFAATLCGHEASADKPSPAPLLEVLQKLPQPPQISPAGVWMVGDTPQDSNAALAAGVLPIRIGLPIWQDNETPNPEIVYFNDFRHFYCQLSSPAAKF